MVSNKPTDYLLRIEKISCGYEGMIDVDIVKNGLRGFHYCNGKIPNRMNFRTTRYNHSILYCLGCGLRIVIIGLTALDFENDCLIVKEIVEDAVSEMIKKQDGADKHPPFPQ